MERTKAWKEEVALAILLWKDFKCEGKFDAEVIITMYALAADLGVKEELDALIPKLPPMKIEPRHK